MMNAKPSSVEEYLSWCSPEVREKLEQMRTTILKAVPKAKEVVSYQVPAYKTTEVLVYFAAANKPLPLKLIADITLFRAAEAQAKLELKKKKI